MKRILPAAPKHAAKDLCDVLFWPDTKTDRQDVRRDETVHLFQALSTNAASTFRWECKISGTEGEEGDDGNLGYVTL